ncbi:hypothetical protein BU17DRAFT_64998 [Hysterangium stoloniferum]|nr:hypothetical protein BU17DRAFT_72282 [Hysterangium stoloniferum]KAF8521234.1 hypothetical protein BU17DRAFT_64998 [Hysterangium stoloniferum]
MPDHVSAPAWLGRLVRQGAGSRRSSFSWAWANCGSPACATIGAAGTMTGPEGLWGCSLGEGEREKIRKGGEASRSLYYGSSVVVNRAKKTTDLLVVFVAVGRVCSNWWKPPSLSSIIMGRLRRLKYPERGVNTGKKMA